MSQWVNNLYAAAPAAVEAGAAKDDKEWILHRYTQMMDSIRKYRESGDKNRLKAQVEAMDTIHKYYVDRQEAVRELTKFQTDVSMKASEMDIERFKATVRGFNDIEQKTSAAQNRLADRVENRMSVTGSPIEAWKMALDSMASEELINEDSMYLPELMDDFTRILSGGKQWLSEDDYSTEYNESTENEVYQLLARQNKKLADEYMAKMKMAKRTLAKQGRYRSWLDRTNQSIAADLQTLQDIESGKYDGKRDEALEQMSALTGNLDTALQSVTDIGSLGEAGQQRQAAKEELLDSDEYYSTMEKNADYLWEQYKGQGDSDSQREKIAEIIGSPKFKWWAEQNNLKLGTVEFDENGNVQSYSMGPHDMVAIYKYNRQLQREKDPAIPLWRPKELARVSYREDVGQPEVFQGFGYGPEGEISYLKIDTWDKEPRYFKKAQGRYVEVPAPEEVVFDALAKDLDGDGTFDAYTQASELRLGSGDEPPGETVLADDTGNYPVMRPVQTAYAELLAPEAGDAVGSKRILTADGREIYIPPENLASYETMEQGRKERRKDKRQAGQQGRQPGVAAGEGDAESGKGSMETWKSYVKRRLKELESDPLAQERKALEKTSDQEAEFSDAMPEEFEAAAGKLPRSIRREQEKTERELGSAKVKDREKIRTGKPESAERIARRTRWTARRGARAELPSDVGENIPDEPSSGKEAIAPNPRGLSTDAVPRIKSPSQYRMGSSPAGIPPAIEMARRRSGTEEKYRDWRYRLQAQQGAQSDVAVGKDMPGREQNRAARLGQYEASQKASKKSASSFRPPTLSVPVALKTRPPTREELREEMEKEEEEGQ